MPPGDPFGELPSQAFIIVEVSDTSLKRNRGPKAASYAAARVVEYWIVNLVDRAVEIHLDPGSAGYARTVVARRGETISLQVFPDVRIDVDRFLR